MDMPSRDRPASAAAADRADYGTWVRTQREIAADAVVLEQPRDDSSALIDDARRRNVSAIVCGFLPDEVDWRGDGWHETLHFLSKRFEFVPYRWGAACGVRERRHVCHLTGPGVTDAAATSLAGAVAVAHGVTTKTLDAMSSSSENVQQAIAGAVIVVNDVADWSLGFAIDEFSARCGCPVIRLQSPGFSPLRHAVLDQKLPAPWTHELPRLRPVLAVALSRPDAGRVPVDASSWFDADAAVQTWRPLFSHDAFSQFWAGLDWKLLGRAPAEDIPGWLHNPAAWAALWAASGHADFPPATREHIATTADSWMASWLAGRGAGQVLDWAASRLMRLRPDWLAGLEKSLGTVRDVKPKVARWIFAGVGWVESPAPRLPLVLAGAWTVGTPGPVSALSVVVAWARDWSNLPVELPPDLVLMRAWRATCVDAVWSLSAGSDTAGPPPASDVFKRVFTNRMLWLKSFGGAATPLWIHEALRCNQRGIALRVARAAMAQVRLPLTGGVARLARAISSNGMKAPPWLLGLAGDDYADADLVMLRLLTYWNSARRWEIWRARLCRATNREVDAAARLCRARALRLINDPAAWQMLALLEGLLGRAEPASQAIVRFAECRGRPEYLPAAVARALALRGDFPGVRAILERHPAYEGEPAVAHFMRAIAWQISGDLAGATRALQALQSLAPRFLAEIGGENDAIWVWGAVVMKRCGHATAAHVLHRRALEITSGSERFLADIECGAEPLAEGWLAFFARALEHTDRAS